MRTLDRVTGAAAGGRTILDRHCHHAIGIRPIGIRAIGIRPIGIRPTHSRGLFQKTIAVMTASAIALGFVAEPPARAAMSRQASKIQMHAHQMRAAKRVRVKQRRLRQRRLKFSKLQRSRKEAVVLIARQGWAPRNFRCLDRLWMRESGWNHRAYNRHSGAYGIPQALPGGKMRSAGRDWRTNPRTQIKWGLGYIRYRYGTPCHAWRHAQTNGWY